MGKSTISMAIVNSYATNYRSLWFIPFLLLPTGHRDIDRLRGAQLLQAPPSVLQLRRGASGLEVARTMPGPPRNGEFTG